MFPEFHAQATLDNANWPRAFEASIAQAQEWPQPCFPKLPMGGVCAEGVFAELLEQQTPEIWTLFERA
eukprot:8208424-Alexandrium_andersonii.AAC.1